MSNTRPIRTPHYIVKLDLDSKVFVAVVTKEFVVAIRFKGHLIYTRFWLQEIRISSKGPALLVPCRSKGTIAAWVRPLGGRGMCVDNSSPIARRVELKDQNLMQDAGENPKPPLRRRDGAILPQETRHPSGFHFQKTSFRQCPQSLPQKAVLRHMQNTQIQTTDPFSAADM